MSVVLAYGSNAQLGVLHGMNRAIPLLRGQGKLEEIESIKDSVFWLNLSLGAVAGSLLWFVSSIVPALYEPALRIIAVGVFLQLVFYYLFSLLRADNRFGLVSQGVSALSILSTGLVIVLALVLPDQLVGALIGLVVAQLAILSYWFSKAGYHFSFQLSLRAMRKAFMLGFPLTILGVLDTVFLSVDRWVIAANLGETAVGYYALGIMASNLLGLVPGSVASVLYPRMLERFGVSEDPASARGLLIGPLRAVLTIMSLLIGGGVFVLPLLVRFWLPKYAPSIPLLEILMPAAFVYAASSIPGTFLVSINRQRLLLKVQIVAILSALALDLLVVRMGWGAIGVAWSTAGAYLVYGGGYMLCAVHYVFDRRRDIVCFFSEVYGLCGAMVLGLVLAISIIPGGDTLETTVFFASARLILYLVILSPALWWANRKGELIAVLRQVFHNRTGVTPV